MNNLKFKLMQAENSSQIPWGVGFQVVREVLGIRKQTQLASLLGVTDAAISDAKKRGVFPRDWAKKIEMIQKKLWPDLVLAAGAGQPVLPSSLGHIGGAGNFVQHGVGIVNTGVVNATPVSSSPSPGGDIARELCGLIVERLEGKNMDEQIAFRARVKRCIDEGG